MKISPEKIPYLLSLLVLLVLSSCGVNSNLMFKTPKGGESLSDTAKVSSKHYRLYDNDSIPLLPREDYKISIDDKFTFTLSTNNGKRILEGLSGIGSDVVSSGGSTIEYLIRSDGYVTLPIIGDINLVGMTVKQSEDTLAKLLANHYLQPFVQLKVTNQRVIVFPGDGGQAKVITLNNNNTTLMEVIAEAGGISDRGKANSIKLMRSINGKREIYPIDLSTLDGLPFADMIVQANDYIYIEPHPKLGREALSQVTPFLALVTTFLVVMNYLNK